MGTLVTLDLPDDSPELALPWIITFGPLDDNGEWEPVVCGPYERAHALSLAGTVVADEELMAVVGPVLPHASVDEIRGEIASARLAAAEFEEEEFQFDAETTDDVEVSVDHEYDEEYELEDYDEEDEDDRDGDEFGLEEIAPTAPPSPEEVRAGFARIAARLSGV